MQHDQAVHQTFENNVHSPEIEDLQKVKSRVTNVSICKIAKGINMEIVDVPGNVGDCMFCPFVFN